MKTISTLLLITLASVGFAQQGINYKALIKDANGNVIANDLIAIQFQILQGASMTNVYQESHTPTTDANGIVNVHIGEGTTSDVFSDIDWGADDHYLNVQVNTGSGLVDMGTTQFMAVPYAKNAETAKNAATKIDDLKDGKSDVTGSSVFLGLDAGLNDDGTDNENVAVGFEALFSNTTGLGNTATGFNVLYDNTTGIYNTANGNNALRYNVTGSYNTANGTYALFNNTTGNDNTANGVLALVNNTAGNGNIAGGYRALYSNTAGSRNTANGNSALYFNTIGNSNTAVGAATLFYNIGHYNSAIGADALRANTTGSYNTANGFYALYNNTTGTSNTVSGSYALYSNTTGSGNTAIGSHAGENNNGSGNVFIGQGSGGSSYTEDNKLYIGNSSTTDPLIYGEFDTSLLRVNGTLNINNEYNFPSIDGAAGQIMQTDGAGNLSWTEAATMNQTWQRNGSNIFYNEGAVAIGVDSPDGSSILHVGGNMLVQSNLGGLNIGYPNNGNQWRIATSNSGYNLLLRSKPDGVTSFDTRMTITGDGNLGINGSPTARLHIFQGSQAVGAGLRFDDGTTNSDWDITHGYGLRFHYGGILKGVISASTGAYIQSSDENLKSNIRDANPVLSKIKKLHPKTYIYKGKSNREKTIGFLAQEVNLIFPELVEYSEKDNLYGIDYSAFSVVAIQAIKEQQKIIEAQQDQINDLKEMVQTLINEN